MSTSGVRGANFRAVPQAVVSAAIFHQDRILLIRRGRPPASGLWSLPGGHIEPGEPALDAIKRELHEETAITAKICGLAGIRDVVQENDRGDVISHRVIIVFCGIWQAGEARAGSDAQSAAWCDKGQLDGLPLTDGLADMISNAEKRLRESPC